MSFDYDAPAELFLAKRTKSNRENYRRFATAAEAIRYAVEDLRTPKALGAWLQVGDERQQHRNPSACTKPVIIRCATLT
jgi:Arc/MetJ-type ribon-helix-helix transcriptional regulator